MFKRLKLTEQEDTMVVVVGTNGQRHHLFRTRAEEDAAVARSPLAVAVALVELGIRVQTMKERNVQTTEAE